MLFRGSENNGSAVVFGARVGMCTESEGFCSRGLHFGTVTLCAEWSCTLSRFWSVSSAAPPWFVDTSIPGNARKIKWFSSIIMQILPQETEMLECLNFFHLGTTSWLQFRAGRSEGDLQLRDGNHGSNFFPIIQRVSVCKVQCTADAERAPKILKSNEDTVILS